MPGWHRRDWRSPLLKAVEAEAEAAAGSPRPAFLQAASFSLFAAIPCPLHVCCVSHSAPRVHDYRCSRPSLYLPIFL
eukprot:6189085-Pleurochrysis_carterae.AAC.6